MRLELSARGCSGDGVAVDALEHVAKEIRRPFVELTDRLGVGRGADLDWWVTPLASRNAYVCPLYLRLCHLALARKLIQSGGVDAIVTDSPALAKTVAGIAGPGVSVSVAGGAAQARWSLFFGAARRYAGALFHVLSQYLFSRLLLPRRGPLPSGPITLVDSFLYTNSFDGGRLHDRHYPGMTGHLDAAERDRVFFAPSYYGVRNYARFFRELRQARRSLILKEDVLRLGDYLFALGHPVRVRWPRGRFDFLGMDVGPLVREAMLESFAGSGAIEGLLRYRFAQRLKEQGLRPQRIVDWFENQEVDHGANAGWRKFFPDTPLIGYQGFLASRHYLCMFPTSREAALRLVPSRVAVMGSGLAAAAREFCPELIIDIAPAFRFEAVWRQRNDEPAPEWFTVLVALPILPSDSRAILDLAVQAANRMQTGRPWRFRVKPHPTWHRGEVQRAASVLPQGFEVVQEDFEALLEGSDALLGTASSTCAHAIARGVPVAVAARPGDLAQNPLPHFTDTSLWAICYTAADLADALHRYADCTPAETARRRSLGQSFRQRVFEPVTRESVRRFLGFDGAGPVSCSVGGAQ